MLLPTKEYAELCHAIRTRFANKIPSEGFILYNNHFYVYTFDRHMQRIYCTGKVVIDGNERVINGIMEGTKYANKN